MISMREMALGLLAAACLASSALASNQLYGGKFELDKGGMMSTNINLVSAKEALVAGESQQHNFAVVDPTGMLNDASRAAAQADIEEDPNDRFITTRSGKRRPQLMASEDEWAEEEPIAKLLKVDRVEPVRNLSRRKRCGGNDDDDGDARRSRRARRARKARRIRKQRAKAARRAAKSSSSTTTVTRKVIQNGQVVSQTSETLGAATATAPGQVIVRQQPAVVPVVQQPVIVQQQPQPAGAVVAGAPSISV